MWCARKAKIECEAPQLAQSGCRCFFLIGSLLLKARGSTWSTDFLLFSHSYLMMEGLDLCGIHWPARLSFKNTCLLLQILEPANKKWYFPFILAADFSYQFFKDFDQLLPTASWGCSMPGENDTAFQKQYSFRSVVAKEWSSVDYLATGAASGNLVVFSTQDKGPVNRRDVVNNAHILGPLIAEVGFLPS